MIELVSLGAVYIYIYIYIVFLQIKNNQVNTNYISTFFAIHKNIRNLKYSNL